MLRKLVFLIVSITIKIYFDFVKNVLKFRTCHLYKKNLILKSCLRILTSYA